MGDNTSLAEQSGSAQLAMYQASELDVASEASPPRVVIYIDKQRLTRDCVSKQLATHLSGWLIEPICSARDFPDEKDCPRTSLVILHMHGASVCTAEVADEMATIAAVAPGSPLVVMSDLDDATDIIRAVRLRVRGYLPTSMSLQQVIGAIQLVGEGGTYIPTCVLVTSPEAKQTAPSRPMDRAGSAFGLSPRELQVLEQLQKGKQNKMIAYELKMCESTVKVHIRHIMKKLNARNRTQVVLLTNNMDNGRGAVASSRLGEDRQTIAA